MWYLEFILSEYQIKSLGRGQYFSHAMQDKLEVCIKDWAELADEYKELELAHKDYRNVRHFLLCWHLIGDLVTLSGAGQMSDPPEEMYVRRDPPEVPAGGHQQAGGGGGHHHQGGAGGGAGSQQGATKWYLCVDSQTSDL